MAVGQRTGERATYLYVSDDNRVYTITRDVTLGNLPGAGLELATTASVTDGDLPRNMKPRGVWWQGQVGNVRYRKFIICNRTGALFTERTSQPLAIDGDPGATTGRRGEAVSFRKLQPVDTAS